MAHSAPRRAAAVAAASALACLAGVLSAPPARAAADHVLITEAYGGGGNSGATYTHDFVELYNPTSAPVDLAGWTVEYFSAGGNPGNTCTLSGTLPPGEHYLIQQAKGAGGTTALPTPDATCGAAMAAASASVRLANAGATVDLVGWGSAAKVEAAAAPAASNTTSVSRRGFDDTDNNAADFTAGPPNPQGGSGQTPSPSPSPTPTNETATTIAQIQGTGAASPMAGRQVRTVGVVTAVYPTGGFNGFYLQTPGSGGDVDATPGASDGIFVYGKTDVALGSCYTVAGTVKEFNGLTELEKVTLTPAADCAPVRPTPLASVPVTDAEKESYEGMLVQPQGTYTITNNYALNQYGQLGLAFGTEPLYTPTDVVAPSEAAAFDAEQQKRYITVDDGSSWDFMRSDIAKRSPLPYLSQAEPMRTNSQVSFVKPVILDYRFQWNYQPTGQVVGATDADDPLRTENDREATPPNVGGNAQLAAFNVLNYFTDLGMDEAGCDYYEDMYGTPVSTNYCEVRGAWTKEAFADQRAKIIRAINGTGAEAVALMEIENSAGISYIDHERDYTLAQLVRDLNRAGGTWAYAESPAVTPSNEDVIRTAFIYNPKALQTLGRSQIDLDEAFANARYPLAQKFKVRQSGKPFVMVANHFKSKGSGEDDGTGQGLSNPAREAQARALTSWVADMYGNEAVFLLGDFNAYSKETPVQIIERAGYTEVVKKYEPTSTTYQFAGRLGSLDHIFANVKAMRLVTGAGVWDINADESIAMQYSRRRYNIVDFYAPDQYASSDHDPVLVGIRTK